MPFHPQLSPRARAIAIQIDRWLRDGPKDTLSISIGHPKYSSFYAHAGDKIAASENTSPHGWVIEAEALRRVVDAGIASNDKHSIRNFALPPRLSDEIPF